MQLRRFGRRLVASVVRDDVDDLAAMMTYYVIFALFPMLLFVLSLTLLVLPGDVLTEATAMASRALPHEVGTLIEAQLGRTRAATAPHVALISGGLTLWGASRGTAALTVALNRVFGVTETRPWWRRQLLAIGVTVLVALLIVLALALLLLGPVLGRSLAQHSGLGATFAMVWAVARWLGAAALMTLVWALLYDLLPDRTAPLLVVTRGAAVGVVLWIAVSQGAALFVTYIADFEATYGALAGALTFLFWLWLSNLALLVGAELSEAFGAATPS